jgi:hypothetical protein
MKTETIQNFILRGGKIEILSAQKSQIKHIVKSKNSYHCGRIKMQYDNRNSSYVIEKRVA